MGQNEKTLREKKKTISRQTDIYLQICNVVAIELFSTILFTTIKETGVNILEGNALKTLYVDNYSLLHSFMSLCVCK